MLGSTLAAIHNLRFFHDLMAGIRKAIREGSLRDYQQAFFARYGATSPRGSETKVATG